MCTVDKLSSFYFAYVFLGTMLAVRTFLSRVNCPGCFESPQPQDNVLVVTCAIVVTVKAIWRSGMILTDGTYSTSHTKQPVKSYTRVLYYA